MHYYTYGLLQKKIYLNLYYRHVNIVWYRKGGDGYHRITSVAVTSLIKLPLMMHARGQLAMPCAL